MYLYCSYQPKHQQFKRYIWFIVIIIPLLRKGLHFIDMKPKSYIISYTKTKLKHKCYESRNGHFMYNNNKYIK